MYLRNVLLILWMVGKGAACVQLVDPVPELTNLYIQAIDRNLERNKGLLTVDDRSYCFHSTIGNSGIHGHLLQSSNDFHQFTAGKKIDTIEFIDMKVDTMQIKQKLPKLIHWNNRIFDSRTQTGMNFSLPMVVDDSIYLLNASTEKGIKDPRMLTCCFVKRAGNEFELLRINELK
jgi:hypothetical protein